MDRAGRALWFKDDNAQALLRLDAQGKWTAVRLPRPHGGLTREDLLNGFVGVSDERGIWLTGARRAWRWERAAERWTEEENCRSRRRSWPWSPSGARCWGSFAARTT